MDSILSFIKPMLQLIAAIPPPIFIVFSVSCVVDTCCRVAERIRHSAAFASIDTDGST